MRLFYTEEFLGWNIEEWPRYLLWAFPRVFIPALVLLSNVLGGAQLTLVLPLVLVVVLAITTIVVVIVVFDGKSNWLEGVTLVGLYGVIAASFWWG